MSTFTSSYVTSWNFECGERRSNDGEWFVRCLIEIKTEDEYGAHLQSVLNQGFPLRSCMMKLIFLVLLASGRCCSAFVALPSRTARVSGCCVTEAQRRLVGDNDEEQSPAGRRAALQSVLAIAAAASGSLLLVPVQQAIAAVEDESSSSMYAPKFVQQYADFTETPEGWSFRQVTPGKGDLKAALGDRVVFDWSGYTIGYFGRPFQAKGGPQGGAFDKDIDFERTVLGSGQMVKGLECAMVGTSPGQVLQIVVPFEKDLSYPADDPNHTRVGPKPTTFSGQRALNFVLENPRVDRTLLFNLKVIRIDKPNAAGGFTRG